MNRPASKRKILKSPERMYAVEPVFLYSKLAEKIVLYSTCLRHLTVRLSNHIYEIPAFSLTTTANGRTSYVHIASSRAYPVEHPGSPGPLLFVHMIELCRHKLFTSKPGIRRGIIDQVFKES